METLVERLERTPERCPVRTTFALMGDLNDDMGISAHGRVHVRDSEDKLIEPCKIGRENVTVARMSDLSAGFHSLLLRCAHVLKVERDRLLSCM